MKGEKATNCWFEHSCNLEDSGCFFGGTVWLPQYSEMIPFDKIVLGHSLDRRCENVRLRPLLGDGAHLEIQKASLLIISAIHKCLPEVDHLCVGRRSACGC